MLNLIILSSKLNEIMYLFSPLKCSSLGGLPPVESLYDSTINPYFIRSLTKYETVV